MPSKFDITTAKWGEVKQIEKYDIAILPWGATEPHNYHLPYCTDMLASAAIAREVAQGADQEGVHAMVLPGLPLGSQNPGQTELPFCLHFTQSTQAAVLRDIVLSLRWQGIGRLLIINGHGGNNFKGFIRDLSAEFPDFLIVSSDWYAVLPHDDYFEESVDDHAGEQETSVIMHYYPELVRMDLAGEGRSHPFAIKGLERKVGWHPRHWQQSSDDTGIGNPFKASAEKGRRYAHDVVKRYVQLVVELARKGLYE